MFYFKDAKEFVSGIQSKIKFGYFDCSLHFATVNFQKWLLKTMSKLVLVWKYFVIKSDFDCNFI